MITAAKRILYLISVFQFIACNGQQNVSEKNIPGQGPADKVVGGGCDGCEIMYIGMPEEIHASDTSAGWFEEGQKLLVKGTVFQKDHKTPAKDVIIYYWQTDGQGYYSRSKTEQSRHGHIRGWVKTDSEGKYSIYTIRPAPYPNDLLPAHIHTSVKEPNIKNAYYLDEFVFNDDPLLTPNKRNALENRGGSGILNPRLEGDLLVAEHDIVLGLNIPDYPDETK